MAGAINHRHHSSIADDPSADVKASNWNDTLIVSGGSNGQVMTRRSGQPDGWDWENTQANSSEGVFASRPAAGSAGLLYLTDDGWYISRDSGTAWKSFGPVFPFVEPIPANYSFVNQGTATLDSTRGSMYLECQPAAADSVKLLLKPTPATPYTIDACIMPNACGWVTEMAVGVAWQNAGAGTLVTAHLGYDSTSPFTNFNVQKWNSPTSFNGAYVSLQSLRFAGSVVFIRLQDDGTNRTVSIGVDGVHWQKAHQVSRTDFLTADHVGFSVNNFSNNNPTGNNLLSWYEH